MSKPLPRGIRNHNPGNIRHGDKWQGMASVQMDKDFVTFTSPEYGIRALGKVLLNYQRKHGINTIDGLVNRYAPPIENNTRAYVQALCRACCVEAVEIINFFEYLPDLIPAIIHHENGMQPYDAATLQAGIALALQG